MAVRGRICLREIALVAPACFAIIDRFCGAYDWFLSRSRRNPSQKGAALVGPLADVNADRSRADRTSYQREIYTCVLHLASI